MSDEYFEEARRRLRKADDVIAEARAKRDEEWVAALYVELDNLAEAESDHERGYDYHTGWCDGFKQSLYKLRSRMTGTEDGE